MIAIFHIVGGYDNLILSNWFLIVTFLRHFVAYYPLRLYIMILFSKFFFYFLFQSTCSMFTFIECYEKNIFSVITHDIILPRKEKILPILDQYLLNLSIHSSKSCNIFVTRELNEFIFYWCIVNRDCFFPRKIRIFSTLLSTLS